MARVNKDNYLEQRIHGRKDGRQPDRFWRDWWTGFTTNEIIINLPERFKGKRYKIKLELMDEEKPITYDDVTKAKKTVNNIFKESQEKKDNLRLDELIISFMIKGIFGIPIEEARKLIGKNINDDRDNKIGVIKSVRKYKDFSEFTVEIEQYNY